MDVPGHPRRRIVLTGGPGGGKTTAADLFRREMREDVVVVPEAATLLFAGGFPRLLGGQSIDGGLAVQRAIFHVQRSLEDVQESRFPGRISLCDRGTVDGAAYWPDGIDEFFRFLGTTLEAEYARYDAVLFFESGAVGGHEVIEGGNPARIESVAEAAALDARLRTIWSKHPRFYVVAHHTSFLQKVTEGVRALESIVAALV